MKYEWKCVCVSTKETAEKRLKEWPVLIRATTWLFLCRPEGLQATAPGTPRAKTLRSDSRKTRLRHVTGHRFACYPTRRWTVAIKICIFQTRENMQWAATLPKIYGC